MSNISVLVEDPEYYSYRYRIVGTVFQGTVFLVGVVGNFMVVVVVLGTRSMRTPTNCYLVSFYFHVVFKRLLLIYCNKTLLQDKHFIILPRDTQIFFLYGVRDYYY